MCNIRLMLLSLIPYCQSRLFYILQEQGNYITAVLEQIIPILGIILMRRNTRPPMLLTRVRTKLVIPSATGYVASQAISKYSGTLAFSRSVASMIAAYNES